MRVESTFNHKQTVQDYTSFMAHRIFITGGDEQARQKAAGLLNSRLFVELTVRKIFSPLLPPQLDTLLWELLADKKHGT